eukprot:6431411-Alexandrium_andersonii.AAC.1
MSAIGRLVASAEPAPTVADVGAPELEQGSVLAEHESKWWRLFAILFFSGGRAEGGGAHARG